MKKTLLLIALLLPSTLMAQDEWMISYSFSIGQVCKGLFFEANSLHTKLNDPNNGIPLYFLDEEKNAKSHPSSILVRRQKFEAMDSDAIRKYFDEQKDLYSGWGSEPKEEEKKPDSYYRAEKHLARLADDYFTVHFIFKGKKGKLTPYKYVELNSMSSFAGMSESEMSLTRKHLAAFSYKDLEALAKKCKHWAYIDNHNYQVNWAEAFKKRYFEPITIEIRKNRKLVSLYENGKKNEKMTSWKGKLPSFVQEEMFWEPKQPSEKQVSQKEPFRYYQTYASISLEDSSRSALYKQGNLFVEILLKAAQNGKIQAYEYSEGLTVPIEKEQVMQKIRKPMVKDYNSILFNQIANWIENGKPSVVLEEQFQPKGHYPLIELSELEFSQELSVNNEGKVIVKPETQWIKIARHGKYARSGISKIYYNFKASDVYQLLEERKESKMLTNLKSKLQNGLMAWGAFGTFYRRGLEVYSKPYTVESSSDYAEIESEIVKKDMNAINNWIFYYE